MSKELILELKKMYLLHGTKLIRRYEFQHAFELFEHMEELTSRNMIGTASGGKFVKIYPEILMLNF